jgi:predicted RNA binding protein YcfA (HicA-like mRNA interferase family)
MSSKFPAVTSDEVINVLQKIGFRFKRQSGSSHAIYYRDSDKRRTNVPVHKGKILKRKTFKSILSDSGLTVEEFNELRKK